MAALVGVLGGIALLGAKPRLPIVRHATPAPITFSFVTSPVYIFMVSLSLLLIVRSLKAKVHCH